MQAKVSEWNNLLCNYYWLLIGMLLSLKVKVRFIGLFQKKSKHGGLKK